MRTDSAQKAGPALRRHASDREICRNGSQVIELDPGQCLGFRTDNQRLCRVGLDQKTGIVVKMTRLLAPRRDSMNIHIEQRLIENFQLGESRLFVRLPECCGTHVRISIAMPPELKPEVELAVVSEKDPRTITADDPCRCGDMPRGQRPVEATRLSLDKSQQALERVLFMFIRGSVSSE